MQLNKQDIESISYDYKDNKMIIKLKNKKLINNFMRDEIVYNCTEKVFIQSAEKFIKEENETTTK